MFSAHGSAVQTQRGVPKQSIEGNAMSSDGIVDLDTAIVTSDLVDGLHCRDGPTIGAGEVVGAIAAVLP